MNWRWLAPLALAALFFTAGEWSLLLAVPLGALTLAAVVYAMSGASWARTAHFTNGYTAGEVVAKEYRVVTSAEHAPIDRPWGTKLVGSRREPERLTKYVNERLGPAILQHAGLVLYRDSEAEARRTESDVHALLDPLFPAPVDTRVERWNEELAAWQPPELAGGDKAMLAALGWETRLTFADKAAARAAAGRIRATGEVMVSWSRRHVTVASVDESAARAVPITYPELAGGTVRVRRLNALSRRRLLANLYDRRGTPKSGWLTWDEPAAA